MYMTQFDVTSIELLFDKKIFLIENILNYS